MDELLREFHVALNLERATSLLLSSGYERAGWSLDELARLALESGIKPGDILDKALIPAMSLVGDKFSRKIIYVPQMLMAAKA